MLFVHLKLISLNAQWFMEFNSFVLLIILARIIGNNLLYNIKIEKA